MFMKKILLGMLICVATLLGISGQSSAVDVYVCEYDGHQVYVSTETIMGSRYQVLVANGVRFIKNGKENHFATAKFYLDGIWWGNVFIDNMPSRGDYPVSSDRLASEILKVAYRYVN